MEPQTWLPLTHARSVLEARGERFAELWRHGCVSLELYVPRGEDLQTPHERDELYVVIAGRGRFFNAGLLHPFQAGDVLFVPARTPHRFEAFTEDFAAWVIFFGTEST
jgi:Mannose-6-phosphate isomerase